VCNAQFSLTLSKKGQVIHKTVIQDKRMRHPAVSTASSLPSLMMPCPVCAGRMVFHGHRPLTQDIEDTVYACRRCGAELIRTSLRRTAKPDAAQAPEAA
jgi:hypothetical protein